MFPLDRFHVGWSKLRQMNLIFAARHGKVDKKKDKTMSIRNKNGIWYYEFMKAGHRYCGTCLDEAGNPTRIERTAAAYEKAQKDMCAKVRANKSVKALTENFRAELTGAQAIPLHEAFQRSLSKPRKRTPCPQRLVLKKAHWKDFINYMADTYPDVKHLAAVSRHHAENYVASLVTFGKFEPRQAGRRRIAKPLSGATISDYITTITEVFELLADDAGILSNPFAGIPKPALQTENRKPFTPEELQTIRENLDDFTRPLFTIAIATALREGDICTLKWSEIDLQNRVIRREKMRKTQIGVDIPIMPPLESYLKTLWENRQPDGNYADYVLPRHAEMYLSGNRCGVSYRVKQFLETKCHIVTTRRIPGKQRAISVKDLHSCRHTFCYYAGLYGIPMNIVQGIVGHLTPEMTRSYSNHATLEAKREKMQLLPDFLNLAENQDSVSRLTCANVPEILKMLEQIPIRYAEELKQLLSFMTTADMSSIITLRRQLTE